MPVFLRKPSARGEGVGELKTSLFSKSHVTNQGDLKKIMGHCWEGKVTQVLHRWRAELERQLADVKESLKIPTMVPASTQVLDVWGSTPRR